MSGPFPAPKKGRPVFVALVDTSAGSEFLELVKLALAATLEALPANALVGIMTVSDCVRCCFRTLALSAYATDTCIVARSCARTHGGVCSTCPLLHHRQKAALCMATLSIAPQFMMLPGW